LFNGWACRIADALNEHNLPGDYVAHPFVTLHGHPEVESQSFGQPVLVGALTANWTPPNASQTIPTEFPECVEVRVRWGEFPDYKAIVVLVAPGNKATRRGRFGLAARCVGYLQTGASVVIVDVVTTAGGSIHHEVVNLLGAGAAEMPDLGSMYAVSYRPAERRTGNELDIWTYPLAVGNPLPTLPLRATPGALVPVDLESTYTETCRRRKLT
jgi:hypothetical protein